MNTHDSKIIMLFLGLAGLAGGTSLALAEPNPATSRVENPAQLARTEPVTLAVEVPPRRGAGGTTSRTEVATDTGDTPDELQIPTPENEDRGVEAIELRGSILQRLARAPDLISALDLVHSVEFNSEAVAFDDTLEKVVTETLAAHQPTLRSLRQQLVRTRREEMVALYRAGELTRVTFTLGDLTPSERTDVSARVDRRMQREATLAARKGREPQAREVFEAAFAHDIGIRRLGAHRVYRDADGATWTADAAQLVKSRSERPGFEDHAAEMVDRLVAVFEHERGWSAEQADHLTRAYRGQLEVERD